MPTGRCEGMRDPTFSHGTRGQAGGSRRPFVVFATDEHVREPCCLPNRRVRCGEPLRAAVALDELGGRSAEALARAVQRGSDPGDRLPAPPPLPWNCSSGRQIGPTEFMGPRDRLVGLVEKTVLAPACLLAGGEVVGALLVGDRELLSAHVSGFQLQLAARPGQLARDPEIHPPNDPVE